MDLLCVRVVEGIEEMWGIKYMEMKVSKDRRCILFLDFSFRFLVLRFDVYFFI